jgi:hypothetical protein
LTNTVWPILIFLLIGICGCECHQPVGELVDDPERCAALLRGYQRPDARKVVFRTIVLWPGREVSLVEVVKVFPEGGFSVAGVTDIGNTLYAVRIDPGGQARVVSKSLPFSNQWLLEGLVAELLVPWNGPDEAGELYRLQEGTLALIGQEGRFTLVFVFDHAGRWQEFRRLSGCRLVSRTLLEWDGGTVPAVMRTDNFENRYHVVRERVSTD